MTMYAILQPLDWTLNTTIPATIYALIRLLPETIKRVKIKYEFI